MRIISAREGRSVEFEKHEPFHAMQGCIVDMVSSSIIQPQDQPDTEVGLAKEWTGAFWLSVAGSRILRVATG